MTECGDALRLQCVNDTSDDGRGRRIPAVVGFDPCPIYGAQGLNKYLRGELLFTIGVVGILLNCVNILVFNANKKAKQQLFTRFIITLLSVSDQLEIICYLVSYSLVYLLPLHAGQDGGRPWVSILHQPIYDFAQKFMPNNNKWSTVFRGTSMTLNRWILVVMSADKFYLIYKQQKFKNQPMKKLKMGASVIVGLALFCLFFNIPKYWEYETQPCGLGITAGNENFQIRLSVTGCSWNYLWVYDAFMNLFLNTVIPCFLILVFNAYIITHLCGRLRSCANDNVVKSGGKNFEKRVVSTIRVSCAVSVLYLILQIPYMIITFHHAYERSDMCRTRLCEEELCNVQKCPLPYLMDPEDKDGRSEDSLRLLIDGANKDCKSFSCSAAYFCRQFFATSGHQGTDQLRFWMHLGLILNCSVNFFIYLLLSASFKETIISLALRCSRQTPNADESHPSRSDSRGSSRIGRHPGLSFHLNRTSSIKPSREISKVDPSPSVGATSPSSLPSYTPDGTSFGSTTKFDFKTPPAESSD